MCVFGHYVCVLSPLPFFFRHFFQSLLFTFFFFFFNDPAPPEISTLSLHDALPISVCGAGRTRLSPLRLHLGKIPRLKDIVRAGSGEWIVSEHFVSAPIRSIRRFPLGQCLSRSEEHTSELQSLRHLVCRLLLSKKNHCPSIRLTLRDLFPALISQITSATGKRATLH